MEFYEAGHGKGTPNAGSGAIKRHTDKKVKDGIDITLGEDLVTLT